MKASHIYVVYFTTYFGELLPPFYIGSTSMKKITSGYHGSVVSTEYGSIWKSELKQHPELFQTRIISEHETRAEALLEEQRLHLALDVVKHPLFMNKAIAGLHPLNSGCRRKMTDATRIALLTSRLGSTHTEETKAKMKESHKKRLPISEETSEKLSRSRRGKTWDMSETGKKNCSEAAKRRAPPSQESLLRRAATMKETLRKKREGGA